jgi:hydroxymethylbilane synthase
MKIILGSRGSKLALWQAHWVQKRLEASRYDTEIKIIKTSGDQMKEVTLAQSGTKGLFIKEIEEALLAGEVDLAVHSLKDLPVEQPAGLFVAAVPEREDPRDVLILRQAANGRELPPGAKVGTGSLRRQSQLCHFYHHLEIVPMRGNIDTRLKKLDRGDCDALVMAAAGLKRLGFESRITRYFAPDEICPAAGQGALALEVRRDDAKVLAAVAPLDHAATHAAVRAERAALKELGGGCQLPIAVHASLDGEGLRLRGVVASPDGQKMIRASAAGLSRDPEELGVRVAQDLLRQGARSMIESI